MSAKPHERKLLEDGQAAGDRRLRPGSGPERFAPKEPRLQRGSLGGQVEPQLLHEAAAKSVEAGGIPGIGEGAYEHKLTRFP